MSPLHKHSFSEHQLSDVSCDYRVSASPPPPVRRRTRMVTTNDSLRTPSPPLLNIPAISRHDKTKGSSTREMTPCGDRAFTVSIPTPAHVLGAPSHIRLVPVRTMEEADAAVLVHPPQSPNDKPRPLLLVGPENIRRVRGSGRALARGARVHPYRIVRVVASPTYS